MSNVKNYSPSDVLLVVGAFPISGYMDGTFITVEPEVEAFSDHCGADGEVSRTRSADFRGTITVNLKQTSASNDILSGMFAADRLTGAGVVPVLVKDASGRSVVTGAQSWIATDPRQTFADGMEGREWKLRVAKLVTHVGGN